LLSVGDVVLVDMLDAKVLDVASGVPAQGPLLSVREKYLPAANSDSRKGVLLLGLIAYSQV
jgi:hypothetical protein